MMLNVTCIVGYHNLVVLTQPMLEQVRMHPLLVTATKDKELARDRLVCSLADALSP